MWSETRDSGDRQEKPKEERVKHLKLVRARRTSYKYLLGSGKYLVISPLGYGPAGDGGIPESLGLWANEDSWRGKV